MHTLNKECLSCVPEPGEETQDMEGSITFYELEETDEGAFSPISVRQPFFWNSLQTHNFTISILTSTNMFSLLSMYTGVMLTASFYTCIVTVVWISLFSEYENFFLRGHELTN